MKPQLRFVIVRKFRRGNVGYKTRYLTWRGGWSTSQWEAIQFCSHESAEKTLGGRAGDIVKVTL